MWYEPHMRRRRVLASLGAASAAGCLRLERADESATETTSTSTDGAVATTADGEGGEEPQSVQSFPVGLRSDGATPTLAATHAGTLWSESFATTFQYENVTQGDVLIANETRVAGDVARRRSRTGAQTRYALTSTGTFWRQPADDGATYGQHRDLWSRGALTAEARLGALFEIGAWDSVRRSEDGGTFVVTASEVGNAAPDGYGSGLFSGRNVRSFSGAARVREDGIVTALDATWTATRGGRSSPQSLRANFRVTDYPDVSASLPSWFETARDRAPSVSASVVADGDAIEVVHESGNPLADGSGPFLWNPSAGTAAGFGDGLSEPLAPGDRCYVYHRDGRRLGVARDGPPAASDVDRPIGGRRTLWFDRGLARYFPGVTVTP